MLSLDAMSSAVGSTDGVAGLDGGKAGVSTPDALSEPAKGVRTTLLQLGQVTHLPSNKSGTINCRPHSHLIVLGIFNLHEPIPGQKVGYVSFVFHGIVHFQCENEMYAEN
ncbi:MAG: hypothetical protein RMJ19_00255 [Gemmatales bacterium]|nr:hypothetical protein [Gemmatales bacterium]MDW8174076.1 hypothetical protein [Gemmatales bacterium]